jgi:DNA polymerase-3 subunit delta'
MAFKDLPDRKQSVSLLQRSLERNRLAHAYLLTGDQLEGLETVARTLAKTLSCQNPVYGHDRRVAIDCCDACLNCRKIEHGNHADVHWLRPESKSRVITIDQVRGLLQEINLKPTEAGYKMAVIVAADRLNVQAANAFLKTLEEPPEKSVIVLLSTEPQRILETIFSRCLRLGFAGEGQSRVNASEEEWLAQFSDMAAGEQKSLLHRYRLLDVLLQKLNAIKSATEAGLTARSPLQQYGDAEKELRETWEDELAAAIEAEYRRQRADLLLLLQHWLRDVWLWTLDGKTEAAGQAAKSGLFYFPRLNGTRQVAGRISPGEALDNLNILEGTQRLLHTNVQEALALEVGLLKLNL